MQLLSEHFLADSVQRQPFAGQTVIVRRAGLH
jgi:hypothetical protein